MNSVGLNGANIVNSVGIFNDSDIINNNLGNNIGMNIVSC